MKLDERFLRQPLSDRGKRLEGSDTGAESQLLFAGWQRNFLTHADDRSLLRAMEQIALHRHGHVTEPVRPATTCRLLGLERDIELDHRSGAKPPFVHDRV